jgi:hypothetical protein
MILDPQGNPVITDEPTVEPVVEPVVEPIAEPVVEPIVEPVVEPTVEPVVPAVVDLGYPSEVAPEFKDLLHRFESKGVKFDDVNLVLNDAIESGDVSLINDAALSSLIGEDAALIKLSLEGVITNARVQSNASMSALYDVAGSQQAFNNAKAALVDSTEADRAMIEAGLTSGNTALQQLAVEKMMSNFKSSPNYSQQGTVHGGENTPDNGGEDNSNVEYVSQRELAEGLKKAMKNGSWDGTDEGETPEVKRLRRGFLALRKYRQIRAQ